MITKYIFKKHVKDCFICAIKPLIYAGFTMTYIGRAKCPHITNTDRPRIERDTTSTWLARICNFFLVSDLVFVIFKLLNSEHLSVPPRYYYSIILPNYINTLNYTFGFLKNNATCLKHTNELITLIDKRKFYGIDSILSKKFTLLLQLWSSMCCLFMFAMCAVFTITITPRELSLESVLLATSMLVNNINAVAFAVYGTTILMVYKVLFQSCFSEIYNTISVELQKQVLVNISLQNKLQFLQQFYITACSNYKRHVFGFGNLVFYAGQLIFTILSMVQEYFFAFGKVDDEGYWYVIFSRFCHVFLAVGSTVICIQVNSIQVLSQDLISSLYKYKITNLSSAEALQVEMLLITLHTERPVLTASHLYGIDVTLLASTSGTAITYVLVALQFHASLSTS